MTTLSYILIAVAALLSGVVVFLVMKFVPRETASLVSKGANLESLKERYEQQLADLNSKLSEATNAKSSVSSELNASQEKLRQVQEQLTKALEGQLDKDDLAKLADVSALNAQIAKLEKKVKDAEEELEEAEDDVDKYKKDLKRRKEELDEINEQLRSEKKKSSNLEEEVQTKSQKLEQTKKVLEVKAQSLSFVQEVLLAEKASDGKELEASIDRLAAFIGGEMADVLKETSTLRIDDEVLKNWALSAKKTWLKNKTTIAFVGEFSAGKTSIVNRILSQDNPNIPLLPVSAKATTAIPTYISGGSATAYQFYSPDNILKFISESTFKRVTKEVLDQIEGLSSLITYFVMKYQNPNLNNLSILDTPGFNSNDSEDSRRTIEVINECDALFWVFDVNAGTVNRSSLKIIKQNLKKPLYIVINKVDTKSTKEVDSVETLIRKTVEDEGIKVESYIRFSSNPKYDLATLMDPIQKVARDTSRDSFLNDLGQSLEGLIKEWNSIQQKSNSEYNNLRKKHDVVVEKYNNAQNQMWHSCQRAADIPQYKSGFLGFGEGFKMTNEQYNQLVNMLNDVASSKCNHLANLFNESNSIIGEYSDAYNQKIEAEHSLRSLNEINQKFNKLIKAYKQALVGNVTK